MTAELAKAVSAAGVKTHARELENKGPTAAPATASVASRGNQQAQMLLRRCVIQAKLEICGVEDPEECEADAVADRVMRMPDGACYEGCAADDEAKERQAVWQMRNLPEISFQSLGIAETSLLDDAVRNYTKGKDCTNIPDRHRSRPGSRALQSCGADGAARCPPPRDERGGVAKSGRCSTDSAAGQCAVDDRTRCLLPRRAGVSPCRPGRGSPPCSPRPADAAFAAAADDAPIDMVRLLQAVARQLLKQVKVSQESDFREYRALVTEADAQALRPMAKQ